MLTSGLDLTFPLLVNGYQEGSALVKAMIPPGPLRPHPCALSGSAGTMALPGTIVRLAPAMAPAQIGRASPSPTCAPVRTPALPGLRMLLARPNAPSNYCGFAAKSPLENLSINTPAASFVALPLFWLLQTSTAYPFSGRM